MPVQGVHPTGAGPSGDFDLSLTLSDISAGGSAEAEQVNAIQRLAAAAEAEGLDENAKYHIRRMSSYCELLARRCGLSVHMTELIGVASAMHDIGMIGVPREIRLKAGVLEPEEFEVMMGHTELGYRILADESSELLMTAASIALTHHERMDGTGYPHALTGTEIPLEGRVAAVADVFEALTSHRRYRPAFEVDEAIQVMVQGRGTHHDPELFDLFRGDLDAVVEIRDSFTTPPMDPSED